ncbi:MAG: hypothetical protein HOW73_00235 [Polyangiaceae bacterium]|nr:hypothetical protein [Polyangiaceae bacterium]
MKLNPFPGPQPYRAGDHARFFGREQLSQQLLNRILAYPNTTVFGPSGAGKSSLVQAGVIPKLVSQFDFRVVRVDSWPASTAPLSWFVRSTSEQLDLATMPPASGDPLAQLNRVIELALLKSDRSILIFLDQLEQLLLPDRPREETEELLRGLSHLASKPIHGLQMVLSLREDYLGPLRDRMRARRELLDAGFRVGPLYVRDMVEAVSSAAASGLPKQEWPRKMVETAMLQVREKGSPESVESAVQAAFAQIVCRALWDQRTDGHVDEPVDAVVIMQRYLDETLQSMGAKAEQIRTLLEDKLVDQRGNRRILTEHEAREVLPSEQAGDWLKKLEDAAILRAAEHEGGRYFELGHDWLAKRLFDVRREREEVEVQRKAETARRAEHVRAQKAIEDRFVRSIAVGATLAVLVLLGVVYWALEQRKQAESERIAAQVANDMTEEAREAEQSAFVTARSALLSAGVRELLARNQPGYATRLLLEFDAPESVPGWIGMAHEALATPVPRTLLGHTAPVLGVSFDISGSRVATASKDGTVRIWKADGTGRPVILDHDVEVLSATFSPDGTRVLTVAKDGKGRIWQADKSDSFVTLENADPITVARYLPDGTIVTLTTSTSAYPAGDHAFWSAQRWDAEGQSSKPLLDDKAVFAALSPDAAYLVAVFGDGQTKSLHLTESAASWQEHPCGSGASTAAVGADGGVAVLTADRHLCRAHTAPNVPPEKLGLAEAGDVRALAFAGAWPLYLDQQHRLVGMGLLTESLGAGASRPRLLSVSASDMLIATSDGQAYVYGHSLAESGLRDTLKGHTAPVVSGAFGPDGMLVTGSEDGTAAIWNLKTPRLPQVVTNPAGPVRSVAFRSRDEELLYCDGTRAVTIASNLPNPTPGEISSPDFHGCLSASFHPFDDSVVVVAEDAAKQPFAMLVQDVGAKDYVRLDQKGRVLAARFNSDGFSVCTITDEEVLRVWDIRGKLIRELPLPGSVNGARAASLSDDCSYVAVAGKEDVQVWKWDLDGPRAVSSAPDPVGFVSLSPNGQWFVVAQGEIVRDTARRYQVGLPGPDIYRGGSKPVLFGAFDARSERIVTTSEDGAVRLWDSPSDTPITLRGHTAAVRAATFSDDGEVLVTGGDDGTVRLWDLSIDSLKGKLAAATNDCLLPDMREAYLGQDRTVAQTEYEACERENEREPFVKRR